MRLKDKVAIVTGAAWGMGASTAELFAAEGACVMVTDILDAEGTDVVARISDSGGQARFCTLDVTSDTDWASVVGETISTFGQIDILVNNAGVSGSHPDLLNTQTWDEQMNVNARGVFLGMQAVIPQMQKAGAGSKSVLVSLNRSSNCATRQVCASLGGSMPGGSGSPSSA